MNLREIMNCEPECFGRWKVNWNISECFQTSNISYLLMKTDCIFIIRKHIGCVLQSVECLKSHKFLLPLNFVRLLVVQGLAYLRNKFDPWSWCFYIEFICFHYMSLYFHLFINIGKYLSASVRERQRWRKIFESKKKNHC